MIKTNKKVEDKLISVYDSPISLDDDLESEQDQSLAVAGKLSIGSNGNPVTIVIEDQETGETLEVNNVQNALLIIEDKRKGSSGWLSVAVGSVEKISEVLEFLAKATLDGLKRLTGR